MPNDNQKKLKVYLDTSVISYLHQEDAPERMRDTQALWQMFKEEKFDGYKPIEIVHPTVLIEHPEEEEYRSWKK